MVLWELCMRVVKKEYCRPFAEFKMITFDFQIIVLAARKNLRPTIADEIPDMLANLIVQCWHFDPDQRPSCFAILNTLDMLKKEYCW